MIVRIVMQVIAELPDEKYGFIDPFTLTINKVQDLIKSGEVRKIDRLNADAGVNIHAEITGEIIKDDKPK